MRPDERIVTHYGSFFYDAGAELSGTTGAVLDPILSLRQRIRLVPGASVRLCFATDEATLREAMLRIRRYADTLARRSGAAVKSPEAARSIP